MGNATTIHHNCTFSCPSLTKYLLAIAIALTARTCSKIKIATQEQGTSGYGCYGLFACRSSSIHLVAPLTKEMISTNNHGGRNYNDFGRIQTITNNNTKDGYFVIK